MFLSRFSKGCQFLKMVMSHGSESSPCVFKDEGRSPSGP